MNDIYLTRSLSCLGYKVHQMILAVDNVINYIVSVFQCLHCQRTIVGFGLRYDTRHGPMKSLTKSSRIECE
jgi:hypothetical protein